MSKDKAPAQRTRSGKVRVRLLCDSSFGSANTVCEMDAEDLDAAVAAGVADPSREAVEYAESLAAPDAEEVLE